MKHLDEHSLEAIAAGRAELASAEARAHLDGCDACRAEVEREREAVRDAALGLRRAMPALDDLDGMVLRAMQAADGAPSRRSLWTGGAIGGAAAIGLAILSLPGTSFGSVAALGRQGFTLGRALDTIVSQSVPGGWIAIAAVGLALALLCTIPMRLLLGSRPATGALALVLAVTVFAPMSAHAYRVEGEWPDRRVTLDVEARPISEALRMASESAGLGLIARLPNDPPVTLHVRDVPVQDVVRALLGDADVVVLPSASLLTVRPDEAPPAPPVPPVPAVPEPPAVPSAPAGLGDRVTFGSDVEVAEGESVRSIYTMGGDARVAGRAFGDVVTMGGDAELEGEVIGNVTTMGGDIVVNDGARVHGDLNAMGGKIEVDEGAMVHGQTRVSGEPSAAAAPEEPSDGVESFGEFFRWALWHALLFLVGLVMLGTMRERFVRVKDELAARPVRSGFGGLFGLIAGGVLCLVLCVTIIGIPVAAILGAALVVVATVGWTVAALWLGSVLPFKALHDRPVHQLGAGIVALFVAGLVPVLGGLISAAALLAGAGAVMATKLGGAARRERAVATGPFR